MGAVEEPGKDGPVPEAEQPLPAGEAVAAASAGAHEGNLSAAGHPHRSFQ